MERGGCWRHEDAHVLATTGNPPKSLHCSAFDKFGHAYSLGFDESSSLLCRGGSRELVSNPDEEFLATRRRR